MCQDCYLEELCIYICRKISSYVFLCILYFENIIFGEHHFKKSIIFYLHFGHKMMNKQVYVESVVTGRLVRKMYLRSVKSSNAEGNLYYLSVGSNLWRYQSSDLQFINHIKCRKNMMEWILKSVYET